MDIRLYETLLQKELITESEFKKIQLQKDKPLSVHWDLRTLLYLGIVLLTTALGILIYKNIYLIGPNAIFILIAVIGFICFGYSIKYSKGYSNFKIDSPNIWFDYVLLLGCLLLLIFTGYIQYVYNVFGNQLGLALFIPMTLLFFAAYYFDHLGVLSMAITNLAAWAGISVTPMKILEENNFNDRSIIYTGLILGLTLVFVSFITFYKKIKTHFAFTYKNFGAHILFISLLAAIFNFEKIYFLWFIILAGTSFLFFKDAINKKSFYFLVITLLYFYIAFSYMVLRFLSSTGLEMGSIYIGIIYFIVSGIGLIRLLIYYNKIFNKNGGLQ